jgi:hypothetical protein
MNPKTILQGKLFGMPRWVFIALLVGGVAVGIFLRRRSTTAAADEGAPAADYGDGTEPVGELPVADPGMAGAGVFAPQAGSVYPVSTPYIPEGLTETIGVLAGTISDISNPPNAVEVPADMPAPAVSTPTTGGGPPKRRPHTVPKPTRAEYLKDLRAVRSRSGKAAAGRFRKRHPSGKA